MKSLLKEIKQCNLCEEHLPLGPNPVVWAHPKAKLVIIGQAPGTKVHNTGIPWNDPSGDQLRKWLNMDRDTFYNNPSIAIVPMGFCYPGKGKSGDLPPRPVMPHGIKSCLRLCLMSKSSCLSDCMHKSNIWEV